MSCLILLLLLSTHVCLKRSSYKERLFRSRIRWGGITRLSALLKDLWTLPRVPLAESRVSISPKSSSQKSITLLLRQAKLQPLQGNRWPCHKCSLMPVTKSMTNPPCTKKDKAQPRSLKLPEPLEWPIKAKAPSSRGLMTTQNRRWGSKTIFILRKWSNQKATVKSEHRRKIKKGWKRVIWVQASWGRSWLIRGQRKHRW